jgi:hypothetical protein
MTAWEYRVISLPTFEAPTREPTGSAALQALNEVGGQGWEAVGMTVLPTGHVAVLLKRPRSDEEGS